MQQIIFIVDFIACSTCFGQYYAHHQELESIIQMVAACGISCCKDGKSNVSLVPTYALAPSYTKITQNPFIKNNPTCFDPSRSSSGIPPLTPSPSRLHSIIKMSKIFIKTAMLTKTAVPLCGSTPQGKNMFMSISTVKSI